MPYVKREFRPGLDAVVVTAVDGLASRIENHIDLIKEYKLVFGEIANKCASIFVNPKDFPVETLGNLNYELTRIIQLVPRKLVELGKWETDFNYWIYASTVEALIWAADASKHLGLGIAGVFEDVKDEWKRRVNVPYENNKILENGDVYEGPYKTKLDIRNDDDGVHYSILEKSPRMFKEIIPYSKKAKED